MSLIDETELTITRALEWLEASRRDAQDQRYGLWHALTFHSSANPEFDRFRLGECLTHLEQFDTVIAQHKERLREHKKLKRLAKRERERLASTQQETDVEPLLYAVARLDVLTVKAVDTVPIYADHPLTTQLSRQAESLEAWNYRCLATRNRRPSRRYEGFRVAHDTR